MLHKHKQQQNHFWWCFSLSLPAGSKLKCQAVCFAWITLRKEKKPSCLPSPLCCGEKNLSFSISIHRYQQILSVTHIYFFAEVFVLSCFKVELKNTKVRSLCNFTSAKYPISNTIAVFYHPLILMSCLLS